MGGVAAPRWGFRTQGLKNGTALACAVTPGDMYLAASVAGLG